MPKAVLGPMVHKSHKNKSPLVLGCDIHRITKDAKSSIEFPKKLVLNIIPQTSTIMNQSVVRKQQLNIRFDYHKISVKKTLLR